MTLGFTHLNQLFLLLPEQLHPMQLLYQHRSHFFSHCEGPGTNTVPTKTVFNFFAWWFWIACVSLGKLRSVQSVSATVNLMHSYCTRLLIVPQVALFSYFPTGVFRSSATSERKGLISHLLPSPKPHDKQTENKQRHGHASWF